MVAKSAHTQGRLLLRARRLLAGTLVAAAAATSLMVTAPGAFAQGPACSHATSTIAQATRSQMQVAVVCLVNRERSARHLPALVASPRLDLSAQGWTNTMVGSDEFTHGAAFTSRITAVGFDWSNVGENIATGFETPTAVVSAWMASQGHCENILSPVYRQVGTGVVNRMIHGASNIDGTWTQDFGLIMGQHPASANDGPASGCPYR